MPFAETNDAIRGRGTFDRILSGVELLAASGYPDLSLNMVVTRVNAGELADFHELARGFGASRNSASPAFARPPAPAATAGTSIASAASSSSS